MPIEPLKPAIDQTRRQQTNILIGFGVALALVAGVWANYESGKPSPNEPEADCYRFPGYNDEQCKLDYAVQGLYGWRGHSDTYLKTGRYY